MGVSLQCEGEEEEATTRPPPPPASRVGAGRVAVPSRQTVNIPLLSPGSPGALSRVTSDLAWKDRAAMCWLTLRAGGGDCQAARPLVVASQDMVPAHKRLIAPG
jgi:hypothetical protein